MEGVQFLARRVPVRLVRGGERGLLPALSVGQRMKLVRGLVQAVLRGRGHGRAAQPQYIGHEALVLPQLLGSRVHVPVVRGSRRVGVRSTAEQVGLDRQAAEDGQRGHGRDDGSEESGSS